MKKNGFTLVELIVSVVLVSVVMVSMLMSLVKLRENYNTVNENANALVYSNAASRIINNDILQNDGIKNISCSTNHLNCDMVLGNGNKRQIQIVEIEDEFSKNNSEEKINTCIDYCTNNKKTNENCNCNSKKAIGIIETKRTSLVYYDTTKEKKLKYIKTFELETKTQIDSNKNLGTSTISGYSFLSLDAKHNTYKSNIDGYENKLSTIIVRTYNGYDAEDRTYDIKMYSSSTYSKDTQLAGTIFKLKIEDDADIEKSSPDTFYLKYDVGYYKEIEGEEIEYLDKVSKKTGYTLLRYEDINGHEVIDSSGIFLSKIAFDNTNTSKKEGIIKPIWEANKYVVSFNAEGGTLEGDANIEVVFDSTYGEMPYATKEGYTFEGWYNEENEKITKEEKVKVASNQTLHAKYIANKYTVTFNPNGGSVSPSSLLVTYKSEYGTLPTPTKEGYTFEGWYTQSSGGANVVSTTKVTQTQNHTLYAHWKVKELTSKILLASYKCANVEVGDDYSFEYTGDCEVIDDSNNNWRIKFLTSGDLTFAYDVNTDIFLVGGGGVGGGKWGGGGGGRYTHTERGINLNLNKSYKITIGSGGSGGSNTDYPNSWTGRGGESSSIIINNITYEAKGGSAGGLGNTSAGCADGGSGGSGGGGGGHWSGKGGTNGNGGNGSGYINGANQEIYCSGGIGQGTTTSEFEDEDGTIYANGGKGCGEECSDGAYGYKSTSGSPNTGDGGEGGSTTGIGGSGGSGIVIIRNAR